MKRVTGGERNARASEQRHRLADYIGAASAPLMERFDRALALYLGD